MNAREVEAGDLNLDLSAFMPGRDESTRLDLCGTPSERQGTANESLSHVPHRKGRGVALAALQQKQVLDRFSQRFGNLNPHRGQSRVLAGGSSFHSRAFSLGAGPRPKHTETLFAKALIQ